MGTGRFALKAGETAVVHGRDGGPWVATIDKIEPITPEISQMLRAQVQGEAGLDPAGVQRGVGGGWKMPSGSLGSPSLVP